MVKIRLARAGKKNDPIYKIVVIDSQKRNTGRAVQIIGHWHPAKQEKKIDKKALQKWLSLGAIPSPAVKELIK